MRAWQLFVGFAGTVAAIVVVVGVYYALSLLVLNITGRVLPLTGRHRRRD